MEARGRGRIPGLEQAGKVKLGRGMNRKERKVVGRCGRVNGGERVC